jgi:hypothetical protein
MAVKLQAIHRPKDLSDQAYRELLILESLTSLATKKQCFHFVTLNQWFKSWNNHIQHMNYVMGQPASNLQSLPIRRVSGV